MGHKYNLATGVALSIILALAWNPAIAQDAAPTQSPPPGSLQGFQLDPSRDTSKPKPPEREGPEIENRPAPLPTPAPTPSPAIATPPPVTRTVQPTAAPSSTPQRPARQQEAQRPPAQEERAPTEPVAQQTAPQTAQSIETPRSAAPSVAAPTVPVPQSTESKPTASQTAPTEAPSGSSLPWIIAALLVAGGAGLAFWLRRKRTVESATHHAPIAQAAPPPEDVAAPVAPAPKPIEPVQPDRPKAAIAIEFHPIGARNTLIGASVGYRIVLHNEGEVAAENVAISSMISNADARQEQGLAGFFAEPVYAPTHSAERIEPGFSVEFSGELRLASEAIVPIQLKDRALLIPLVAFSAHYGWEGGNGYSAAAFIVGEESDPPRERMAPFRVDQGPRQYRSVGSRPARTALVG